MDTQTTWKIINRYFEDNPQCLVTHHIESYNDFFRNGIFQIFKEKNPIKIMTRFDKELNDYRSQCIMYFGGKDGSKVYFGKPVIYDDNDNSHYMYPNEARLRNMTYGMTVHYDVEVEFITILEDGEMPTVIGLEDAETYGGYDSESDEEEKATDKATDKATQKTITVGGAPKDKPTGPPKRKNQRRRIPVELTPAETALFKEATAKSMITPNTQKETIVLEKIFLGKFPIMVQSNYCVLSGLPREVRHTMGECKNDIGGYFIIDGKEKTVVSQEKFGDNMLYIKESTDETYLYSAEIRSVSENVAKPIRTLSVKIVAPTPTYTYKNIVVNIPNVRKPVPLFIVFRALGIISDKQIITMCLLDLEKHENLVDHFIPSVHDAGGIMTQRNALKYIATLTKGKTISHALLILADYFLPHIGEVNFTQKAYYLGYVVFRLLNVYVGVEPPTDRDNFKFKRIELVGALMYDLFREYFTLQQRQIELGFEEKVHYNQSIYANNLKGLIRENYKDIFMERSVEAGFKKAFKGNWGASAHTKRIGIIQDLNRLSFNSALSHLRKTNLPLDASVKLVGPRVLHSTQWGIFDPIDTPDGGNIGLHKHLSISAYVTQGYSREPMVRWLREKGRMKLLEECSPAILATVTKVIVNGLWAGAITEPIEIVEKVKLYRRNGLIPIYTSVTFDVGQNTVFIYTDAGRICRPIFYKDAETGKFSFESPAIKRHLEDGDFTWAQLVAGFNPKKDKNFNINGYKMYELDDLYENIDSEANPARLKRFLEEKAILDYIDTNESEDALIAMNAEALGPIDGPTKHTHLEIHESLIFGMMCNLINFPENNPATRNSFSCGQSKQACSIYHTNHQVRMDKTAVVLQSSQNPLVKTRYLEYINHEGNPYGENAIVAIMCYTGYNVEDAVLINEGALKRGLFRTTYYSTYESHEEKSKGSGQNDSTSQKSFTNIENNINVVGTKPGYDYSKLDKYGLVRENTEIDDKTVLIGVTMNNSENPLTKIDMSKTPKKGQLGVVDKTFITDGEEGTRIAKIRIREVRVPNLGDKMASRSGQKGTIGLVIPESDMPFTKDGLRPDIIVNPHAIPTRMTIGQLVETITGKACAIYGGYGDCTAFINNGSKVGVFGDMLVKEGYHSSGNEILYNGMTGEQIDAEIFIGPNYYMRLKHMVKDKINFRALGPRTALTRQPVSGRANDGGLRIGEMERDAVISHGAAEFLRESMMERGDKYSVAVCNNTGMVAIYNPSKNLFMSPMADGPLRFVASLDGKDLNVENITKFGRNFSVVDVPYSLKLLIQELQTCNIQMRLITEDNIKQMENLSYSKNIDMLLFKKDVTPKSIVDEIKRSLQGAQGQEKGTETNLKTPEVSVSPEVGFPEGVSPAYQPSDEEIAEYARLKEMFKKSGEESSPEYIPYDETEEFSPHSPDESPPPITNEFSPHSPTSPPNFQVLSEQAGEYRLNEQVHYRGDIHPERYWIIKNIGDTFITIETGKYDEYDDTDTTQVVTALDIYRDGDVPYNSPYLDPLQPMTGYTDEMSGGGVPRPNMSNIGGFGPNPAINFAPVFKIMNGGNDFSTEPMGQYPVQQLGEQLQTNGLVQTQSFGPSVGPSVGPSTQKSSEPEKLDFGKLVIKKV
jgi:DNA-directed RNA polymerase II subunit RPB2